MGLPPERSPAGPVVHPRPFSRHPVRYPGCTPLLLVPGRLPVKRRTWTENGFQTITPADQAGIGTDEINPNHSELTRVVSGPGSRSHVREELPLSTRVHELAKELNLKSQELLDRIQKWGLDVKVSALASLDPSMVDRIKALMDHPTAGHEAESSSPAPGPLSEPEPQPVSATTVATATRPGAAAPSTALGPKPAGPSSGLAPTRTAQTAPIAASTSPSAVTSVAPSVGPEAPQRLIPGSSPVARPPTPGPAPIAPTPAGQRPPAPAQAPLSRPGGGFSGSRPSGPLSAHTPHRGTGPGGGPRPGGPQPPSQGPRHEPRLGQPGASPPSVSPSGGSGFQPLKQSDYMSSAGIRPMTPRVTPSSTSSSSSAGVQRRPGGGEPGSDAGRRDREPVRGTSRPLPSVAAPILPPQRPSGPQRPAPSAPVGKTQRPEKKMTPEEIMAFRRSGQVPTTQAPPGGPAGPGAGQGPRPGQLLRGTGPGPGAGRLPPWCWPPTPRWPPPCDALPGRVCPHRCTPPLPHRR